MELRQGNLTLVGQEDVLGLLTEVSAIEDGHFVYKSGRHGGVYVNKDAVFPYPTRLRIMAGLIAFHFKDKGVEAVAGPAIGAVALAHAVADKLVAATMRSVHAVFLDEGPDKTKVIKRNFGGFVEGKNVLVVEDIMTTGGSAAESIKGVFAAGAKSIIGIGALFNRHPDSNTAERFQVPEVFSLVEHDFVDYLADECPFCRDGVHVNTQLGHGRQFLNELKEIDPAKLKRLAPADFPK